MGEGLQCDMPGQQPNEAIPSCLNRHAVYAQVSEWEGHPKTLIEAMACARACLVANAPGLAGQIDHGRTGWVADATEPALASAMDHLFQRPSLRADLGAAAREHITGSMSFETVFEQECSTLNQLIGEGPKADSVHEC